MGSCVMATPTTSVRLYTSSVPAEVAVQSLWSSTAFQVLVVATILLSLVCLCVIFTRCSRAGVLRRRACELAVNAPLTDEPHAPGSGDTVLSGRRVLMLYWRSGPEAVTGAVHAISKLLRSGGRVQVIDMYDDAELLERGPVLRASDYMNDVNTSIVVVVSTGAPALLHPPLRSFNTFQSFIVTMLICLNEDRHINSGRVFTVSLDARESACAFPGIPVSVVYIMPYHLMDLLRDVPGVSTDWTLPEHFQDEVSNLRKCVKHYTQTSKLEVTVGTKL